MAILPIWRSTGCCAALSGVLAIASVLSCQAAETESVSNTQHKSAMQAFKSGNFALAEQLEKQAINANPKDPLAHQGLAVIYAQQGKLLEAVEEAKRALQLNAHSFSHQFNLAELLMVAGKPEEALIHFNEALKINPSSTSALVSKSRCLTVLGNPLKSLEFLENAPVKNAEIQLQLAKTYLTLGDLDKTEALAEKLLEKQANNYDAKFLIAEIQLQRRNLPAAVVIADELIKSDPTQSGAYLLLSECFVITHSGLLNAVDLVQSAKQFAANKALVFPHLALAFERCASSTTKSEPAFDERKYAWRALAEECWRQAVKARPASADFHYRFALCLRKNRKFVESYYQAEKCLELDPDNKAALALKDKLKQTKYDLFGWLRFYFDGGLK